MTEKRPGHPAYVRCYKGSESTEIHTTHNLFEIEWHQEAYTETVAS